MKKIVCFFLVFSLLLLTINSQSFGLNKFNSCFLVSNNNTENVVINNPPVAVNDTITVLAGVLKSTVTYNILANDYDPENDKFILSFIYAPYIGEMKVDCEGTFNYTAPDGYLGSVTTSYIICETENKENKSEAKIFILVKNDYDNDGIADDTDIDNDNDGILDIDDGIYADTDKDGIPNYLDIDSDNDGIPDNIEGQPEAEYFAPFWKDSDIDGWDDAYDFDSGGTYFKLTDTDKDGTPDFLDTDSDDDSLNDILEANSIEFDGTFYEKDSDRDGLDDNFDIIQGWLNTNNPCGSNVTLPDSDNNGIRDWRDSKDLKPEDGDGNALMNNPLYFVIYPNPTENEFNIEIPSVFSSEIITMEIMNLEGKSIYRKTIQNAISNFKIQNIGKGIYFVRLTTNSNSYIQRLIISQ